MWKSQPYATTPALASPHKARPLLYSIARPRSHELLHFFTFKTLASSPLCTGASNEACTRGGTLGGPHTLCKLVKMSHPPVGRHGTNTHTREISHTRPRSTAPRPRVHRTDELAVDEDLRDRRPIAVEQSTLQTKRCGSERPRTHVNFLMPSRTSLSSSTLRLPYLAPAHTRVAHAPRSRRQLPTFSVEDAAHHVRKAALRTHRADSTRAQRTRDHGDEPAAPLAALSCKRRCDAKKCPVQKRA